MRSETPSSKVGGNDATLSLNPNTDGNSEPGGGGRGMASEFEPKFGSQGHVVRGRLSNVKKLSSRSTAARVSPHESVEGWTLHAAQGHHFSSDATGADAGLQDQPCLVNVH